MPVEDDDKGLSMCVSQASRAPLHPPLWSLPFLTHIKPQYPPHEPAPS